MAVDYELTLNDYLSIVRRRAPYIAAVFLLVLLAAVVISVKMPPVYQSTGTIMIESQQLPQGVVQDAVQTYAVERIEKLKQRVMTRDRLYQIAKKYNLFDVNKGKSTVSEIVDVMRKVIVIKLIDADVGQWGAKATFAFQVSFDYGKSDTAYQVTNEMVQLFLGENERERKERAIETTEFLGKEADRQRIELEKIEKEVTIYKQGHSGALPQNTAMQMASLQRLEADLREVQRNYSTTQAELRNLELELESAKAGVGIGIVPVDQSPASELEKLRTEYAKLSGIYKENHPSLRALQRKIETLEKSGDQSISETRPATPTTVRSVMVAKVQGQIEAAKARLASLAGEESALRAKLARVEGLVIQTPQVEGALATLLRDYDNAKSRYEEIKAKQVNAKMTEKLEIENKGERLVLIEAPLVPEKPIKPNRLKIIMIGFLAAIAAALAVAMLMENLDKRVRGVEALSTLLQIRPMVVIPYMTNQAELRRRSNYSRYAFTGIVAFGLITLLLVHFFVTPLDVFLSKS